MLRSLYECFHARVKEGRIYCAKGHKLPNSSLKPLEMGAPLEYTVCQKCLDFSRMGKPIAAKHRGWNNAGKTV
jgi:hypothetical protein